MFVLPPGVYTPVAPIAPVAPILPRKTKAAEKTSAQRQAASRPTRSAAAQASHSTRAALDDMKLGG